MFLLIGKQYIAKDFNKRIDKHHQPTLYNDAGATLLHKSDNANINCQSEFPLLAGCVTHSKKNTARDPHTDHHLL